MKNNYLMKFLRATALAAFVPAIALSNEIGSGLRYVPQPFDVQNYAIEAEILNPPDMCIQGVSKIDLKLLHESTDDRFFFHLFDLNVDSCVIKGVQVLPVADVDELGTPYYAIPIGNYTDDEIRINIYYSGMMTSEGGDSDWGGVHYKDSILFNLGPGMTKPNVSCAGHWFPCYDHASDKATYSVQMTFPEDLTLASAGFIQSEESDGEGYKTVKWKHDYPAATYMMGFAIGRFERFEIENTGDIPNVIYSRADKVKDAQGGLRILGRMLECFQKYFGAYPFDKVGYVVTPIGSMEHQSMIAVAKGALLKSDSLSDNAAHELAHSWFGGCVTHDDFRSVWLKEGMASYCESLWRSFAQNDTSVYHRRMRVFAQYYHDILKNETALPLHDFSRTPAGNYPNTIYKKGAVVIGLLRYVLGDEQFFGAMNHYLDKFRYGNTNTAKFKEALEEYTGKDLTEFFDMWVYGIGYPTIDLTYEKQPLPGDEYAKYVVNLKQVQDESWGIYKDFPFEMNFRLPSGEYVSRAFNVTGPDMTIELDSIPLEVTSVFNNLGKVAASPAKVASTTFAHAENNENLAEAMVVYPNPILDGNVNFELNAVPTGNEIHAELYAVTGETLGKFNLCATADNRYSLQVNGLTAGNYFLKISDSRGIMATSKIDVIR